MFDRRPADYKEDDNRDEELVWNLSDHSGAPEKQRSTRPVATKRAVRPPASRAEQESAPPVYPAHQAQHVRDTYLALAIGGLVIGVVLTLIISALFNNHGQVTMGITPMQRSRSFYLLTPDEVKGRLTLVRDFRDAPAILDDLSMFVEHGASIDPVTQNLLVCNIYEDTLRQKVYGVEFIVDTSSHPVQDEGKIQDCAGRLFQDAMPLTGSELEAKHAGKWEQAVLRLIRRIGAVSQSPFGLANFTCYGTPWSRSLLVTPR